MTCLHFDHLTEAAQLDIIWEYGTFLSRRHQDFYRILLFQIQGFYTEVYYHVHFNVIIKIKSFHGTDSLAPYLDTIALPALFEN